MKNSWKWVLGIVIALLVLTVLPYAWRFWMPWGGYGMMGGYGGHMPLLYGGFGMIGFGMLFMWLIPLGLLALIGLGIAWLAKSLQNRN